MCSVCLLFVVLIVLFQTGLMDRMRAPAAIERLRNTLERQSQLVSEIERSVLQIEFVKDIIDNNPVCVSKFSCRSIQASHWPIVFADVHCVIVYVFFRLVKWPFVW